MQLTLESRRLLVRLLRREFDQKGVLNLIYLGDGRRLANLAAELGLHDLAKEMTDDINCELTTQNAWLDHYNLKNCA